MAKRVALVVCIVGIPFMILAALAWRSISVTKTFGVAQNAAEIPLPFRPFVQSLSPTGPLNWTAWHSHIHRERRLIVSGNISPEAFAAAVKAHDLAAVSVGPRAMPTAADERETGGNRTIDLRFGPDTRLYMAPASNVVVRRFFHAPATGHFVLEIRSHDR
jgi:hypothetical protein